MLGPEFRYATVLPEPYRKVSARVKRDGVFLELPCPVRFREGAWYNAETGAQIIERIWQWREFKWHGHTEPHQPPSPTPKLDVGLAAMLGLSEAPKPRSWYSRERPSAAGDLGEKFGEAMRAKIRLSLLAR